MKKSDVASDWHVHFGHEDAILGIAKVTVR